MSKEEYRGDPISFWELLSNHRIEIPIIQRDYAQGRLGKEEILNKFLSALHVSIVDEKPIKLDFVYGSIDNGVSCPLDGQQRLTTLFLLHWYAAVKDKQLDKTIVDILKRFTYETRISSRDFCNALVLEGIEIEKDDIPSNKIIDSSWFFLSWKKDPTISSMLRTIDVIHSKFFDVNRLWNKIIGEERLIEFYHIDLEGIGLTDDLYIKMNARGRLLTSFENFKASLQKRINNNGWDNDKLFLDRFASKIDTKWIDLFWNYSSQKLDDAFMRFIATVVMCRQALGRADSRFAAIASLQEHSKSVRPSILSKEDFDYLCEVLDCYYKIYSEKIDLRLSLPFFQHQPESDIFNAIIVEGNNASYTQKAIFYAQTEYILRVKDFDLCKFSDWMRVIRNIISRGDVIKTGKRPAIIRSPQTFDGVINLIHELSEGCDDIYNFLGHVSPIKSQFAKEQVEEERLKARNILNNFANRECIFYAEDSSLLQGRINFALYCIDYDSNEFFQDNDRLNLRLVANLIYSHFSNDSDITNDLRRALLTICDDDGNYNYYGYWWSFWNVVSSNKRCLLDGNIRALEFYIYGNNGDYKIYLKKLIMQLKTYSLKEIAENFVPPEGMEKWKVRLIKEPKLLNEMCDSNHLAIPDDNACCYLLKSLRPRDINGCERII